MICSDLHANYHIIQAVICKPVAFKSQVRVSTPDRWRLTSFVYCTQGAGINFNHAGSVLSVIRRAVLAQLLGVLGHMYNYLYTYLLSKPVTLVTSLRGCTEPENAETS